MSSAEETFAVEEGSVAVESVVTSLPPEVTAVVVGVTPVESAIVTVRVVKEVPVDAVDATPLLSL